MKNKETKMLVKVQLSNPIQDPNGIFPDIKELWFRPSELIKLRDPEDYNFVAKKYKVNLECWLQKIFTYKKCKVFGVWAVGDGIISVDKIQGKTEGDINEIP